MDKQLEALLNSFDSNGLEDVKQLSFAKRREEKYILHFDTLFYVLPLLKEYYSILEISNQRYQTYETQYWDTPHYDMFHQYQRKIGNRYKIRTRQYLESGIEYIELKHKNNKDFSLKKRQRLSSDHRLETIKNFIKEHSPYQYDELEKTVKNRYFRISLLNKINNERITIDINFHSSLAPEYTSTLDLSHLAIIESKKLIEDHSFLEEIFLKERYFSIGFSKYAMAVALLKGDKLKTNQLKRKQHLLKKHLERLDQNAY